MTISWMLMQQFCCILSMTQTHSFSMQVTPKICIQFFPTYHILPCLLILSEIEPVAQNLSTYLQTALFCKTGTSGNLFEFITHLMAAQFIIYTIQKYTKQL